MLEFRNFFIPVCELPEHFLGACNVSIPPAGLPAALPEPHIYSPLARGVSISSAAFPQPHSIYPSLRPTLWRGSIPKSNACPPSTLNFFRQEGVPPPAPGRRWSILISAAAFPGMPRHSPGAPRLSPPTAKSLSAGSCRSLLLCSPCQSSLSFCTGCLSTARHAVGARHAARTRYAVSSSHAAVVAILFVFAMLLSHILLLVLAIVPVFGTFAVLAAVVLSMLSCSL